MESDIKMIALDLDGTLYQRNGQIGEFTKGQVRRAIEHGILVVLSTGRPYVGLPLKDAEELGIQYAITANGAAIYEIPSKICLNEKGIMPEVSIPILKDLYRHKVHLDVLIQGNAYTQDTTLKYIENLDMPDSVKNYMLETRQVVPDLCQFISENQFSIQKIVVNFQLDFNGTYVDRKEVKDFLILEPEVRIVSGGYKNLEINERSVSKASGLHFLCMKHEISIKNTMVCGDSENDIEIMQAGGYAVAMENATPKVKSIAHHITSSCDNDGVGYAIKNYLFNE